MRTAYSYARFSTPEQAKGDSLRRQLAESKRWCIANGYHLSEESFADKGKSGYKGEHLKEKGELKRFLSLVENGTIPKGSILLVENFDRISRLPPFDSANLFWSIINAGIGVVFTKSFEPKIINQERLNKEESILLTVIGECIRAYRESKRKSELVTASKQEKKERMKRGEILPHNNVPKYFSFNKVLNVYEHNEHTPLVREMVKRVLAGESLYKIACDFNNRHIPTIRRKFQWAPNSIGRILRNRVLIGEYLGVPNFVPAIIDEAKFLSLQNILNQNLTNRGKTARLVNIFKGVCFCEECGKPVNALSSHYRGFDYRYLRCSNYGKRNSCTKAYLPLALVEKHFLQLLNKHPDSILNPDGNEELKLLREDIARKVERVGQIGKELEKLFSIVQDIQLEEGKNQIRKLNNERQKLKGEIDALNAKEFSIRNVEKAFQGVAIGKLTRFGEGEMGEDVEETLFDNEDAINELLADNQKRERLRVLLPALIGKILVSSKERKILVYNRMGKLMFSSPRYRQMHNASEKWIQGIKSWTKRKLKDGRTITVKRYQGKRQSTLKGPDNERVRAK